jgi:biotin-dependent carboxylase-like uncharacterized protein
MGLYVVHAGASTTVQDRGRTGYREWGVPVGGAFDRAAAALANALLGNAAECAVLELTLFGGTYEARVPLALALAGAPMAATIRSPDGSRHALSGPLSFPIEPGERLEIAAPGKGARAYLAVRGGWQTSALLGSRSTESLVKAGELLPAASATTLIRRPAESHSSSPAAEPLRIVDGPDSPSLVDVSAFEQAIWRTSAQSSRMGIRLDGPALSGGGAANRVSTPIAPGAVQIAGAQVIVLGVACGTMGGYPHVAHVISADLDRVAQLRPGDPVRFRRVTLLEARRLDTQHRTALTELIQRISTLAGDDRQLTQPAD